MLALVELVLVLLLLVVLVLVVLVLVVLELVVLLLVVLVLVVLVLVLVGGTKIAALKIFGGFIFTFKENIMSCVEIITFGILRPFGDFPLHLNFDLFIKISKQITNR